jgi:hypothetical protein
MLMGMGLACSPKIYGVVKAYPVGPYGLPVGGLPVHAPPPRELVPGAGHCVLGAMRGDV